MKLFGKIVLAAVAVTSVIAFSSCSQETPVAAYQYKDADGNTFVFYGDETTGSFTVSKKEQKFDGKGSTNPNPDAIPTEIFYYEEDGVTKASTTDAVTEVTVPSYAVLKGTYTITRDKNGDVSGITFENIEEYLDKEGNELDWAAALATEYGKYEYSETLAKLDEAAAKKNWISKPTTGTNANKYVIKRTADVSKFGKYGTSSKTVSYDANTGAITADPYTFDEVL